MMVTKRPKAFSANSARSAVALRVGIAVCGAWMVAASAAAQPATLRLTLEDAVARGIATSHPLAEARALESGANAVVDERHAASLPQVVGLGSYSRTNHVQEFGLLTPDNQFQILYPD